MLLSNRRRTSMGAAWLLGGSPRASTWSSFKRGELALPKPVVDFDGAKAATMLKMVRRGVDVHLPRGRPPYRSQLQVIDGALRAAEASRSAFLESPTGTGKTQALLSAALATQRHLALKGEKVGKIIFATRTIGQVRQLPGELRKNPYRSTSVPLASRVHYCTNDALVDDRNAASSARLSQTCRTRGGEKRGFFPMRRRHFNVRHP